MDDRSAVRIAGGEPHIPAGPGFATLAIHAGARSGRTQPSCPADASAIEDRIAALEGGTTAVAAGSGGAAWLLVLHALLEPGDEVVACSDMFGPARAQIVAAAGDFRWSIRWTDPAEPDGFAAAVSPATRAILVESVSGWGSVTDIGAAATLARGASVPLVVDNSWASPYMAQPIDHGADIVVHSRTSLLSGGSSGGAFIVDAGSFDWLDGRSRKLTAPRPDLDGLSVSERFGNFAFAAALRASSLRSSDRGLSPATARRIGAGLDTLALRMPRQSESALVVAQHLARHGAIASIRYAGLGTDADHALARKYCPNGAGMMVTADLKPGLEACRLGPHLQLAMPGGTAGGTRSTLLDPPGHLPHALRLSIGLEDVGDLLADLDQALAKLA